MTLNEIKETLDDAILHDCPVHHTYVKALWDQVEEMQKTLGSIRITAQSEHLEPEERLRQIIEIEESAFKSRQTLKGDTQ